MTAVNLPQLQRELDAAGVPVPNGLVTLENTLETVKTPDGTGGVADLPPAADPVLAAHVAVPPITDVVRRIEIDAPLRTTDATAHEIYRLPLGTNRLYTASLTILGVDAGNFVSKSMDGRFTFKRL